MLAMDANFHLKMKEHFVEGDSALGPGWAYFVNPGPYYEQLELQGEKDIHKIEVRSPFFSKHLGPNCLVARFVRIDVPGYRKSCNQSERWLPNYWCWCCDLCS